MKRYLIILCLCYLPNFLHAQTTPPEDQPGYLKYPDLPAYQFTLPDNHVITKADLKKNVQTIMFIFSVECDHCKHLTEELLQNIDKFKKVQILMVTPFPVDRMKEYYDTYKIKNYPNIIMASEPTRAIMYFYNLHYFPGLFIYNKKQQFVKGFEGTVKLDSLQTYLK
jgi:cytochrome oxidase Cu insertion factor (SCO1/SenC/PrrC family)